VGGRDPFIFAVLSFALLLRTYHLAYPAWDYFASRQTFNLMVVRTFVRDGINLFRPAVDWLTVADPWQRSYFCAEFPWLHALAAAEIRVFAVSDWCTRFIPIAFSLGSIWWIYNLTRRVAGESAARFAALALAVLPFSVFFGRTFMSDLPAISLATGALNAFTVWLKTRRSGSLLVFAGLGCLALLAKPQAAAFGMVAAYLGFAEFRARLFAQWRLYLVAAIVVLPAALWMDHTRVLSGAGGPPVIGFELLGRSLGLWLKASSWREQWDRLFYSALGPLALVLTAAGLVCRPREARGWLFHVWFLSSALILFLIPGAIIGWNDYYLLLLVPPAAGLIGLGLGSLYERGATRAAALALSLALVISSIWSVRPLFRSDELHFRMGRLLNRLTQSDDLIATSAGGAPDPLYFSERRGWEANRYTVSRVEELAEAGGTILAIADPEAARNNAALIPLLDRRFRRLTQEDNPTVSQAGWAIWALRDPPFRRKGTEPEKQRAAAVVDFGGEVGLIDASIHSLIDWPASFEVTYDWRCLSKIDVNLRVFAHVTTPDGRTVFQQDHWPLGGRLPTTVWNPGDEIRERYVVVFKGAILPGRYQLRVGWFDPAGGRRLPIAAVGPSAAATGENDRATVAEFMVEGRPVEGWFRAE